MSIDLKLKPNWDRWYNLIDHPVQVELMNAIKNGVRFPVVPAGRRSGKTERFKRFIVKQAWKNPNELYFAGAPTYQQVKKIFWQDLKRLSFAATFPKSPSESDLIIYFQDIFNLCIVRCVPVFFSCSTCRVTVNIDLLIFMVFIPFNKLFCGLPAYC